MRNKMKWIALLSIVFCFFTAFLNAQSENDAGTVTEEQKIDPPLLFQSNLPDKFADEIQAAKTLDDLAADLIKQNLNAGEVHILGYAAYEQNNIDCMELSRKRAEFVAKKLEDRGVPVNLFAEPIGKGTTYEWGDNLTKQTKAPNRRVRIMVITKAVPPPLPPPPPPPPVQPVEPDQDNGGFFAWLWDLIKRIFAFIWSIIKWIFDLIGSIIKFLGWALFLILLLLLILAVVLLVVHFGGGIMNIPARVIGAIGGIPIPGGGGGSAESPYHGGRYGDLENLPGTEKHHMPPWNSFPKEMKNMKYEEVPAIHMDINDHKLTLGYSGKGLNELYDQMGRGEYRKVVKTMVKDVKQKFPGKYDKALKEFLRASKEYEKIFLKNLKKIKGGS